jgi:hypothetical protein
MRFPATWLCLVDRASKRASKLWMSFERCHGLPWLFDDASVCEFKIVGKFKAIFSGRHEEAPNSSQTEMTHAANRRKSVWSMVSGLVIREKHL